MSFIGRWLGHSKTSARIGLRPHREIELALDGDAAYERCRESIERILGANLAIDDRRGGCLEAGFGLVNSERIRCTFTKVDPTHTTVRIEAFFPAGSVVPARSQSVDALAEALVAPTH